MYSNNIMGCFFVLKQIFALVKVIYPLEVGDGGGHSRLDGVSNLELANVT